MFVYVVTRSICGGSQFVDRAFASEDDAFDYVNVQLDLGRYASTHRETWTFKEWVDEDGDVVRVTRSSLQGSFVNEIPICCNRWRAE